MKSIIKIELDILLDAVKKCYGYDFSHYSKDVLIRRLSDLTKKQNVIHISELIPRLLWEQSFICHLIETITISITEFFRDPDFFDSYYKHIVPVLTTYPYFKLWHPGCSTGEEPYSVAILLQENNLLDKAIIYGTDISSQSLESARLGVYSLLGLKKGVENCKQINDINLFDYFSVDYKFGKIDGGLSKKITFSYHNLAKDSVFGEMNVICCRNVLIYFDNELKNSVLTLLANSLRYGGFLCLGKSESLHSTVIERQFDVIDHKQSIYRKRLI
ncbi:CheR family methyltransferase [Spartinivicinus poritis]|uniref:Protein-glutamate O-methyltransferase CheR n=1 Tax=Spartinivicinus poritis TaxID=2994640 RepID=A0ABT5U8P7_9GAMM|nr:protein-glutamate O-methyltransferase CheR [Spartinivicinus sp. A2-2]MDE1462753.1 protein-glutamate O-methyltransferase CheR [Spartinivicinus sp. A2-2]